MSLVVVYYQNGRGLLSIEESCLLRLVVKFLSTSDEMRGGNVSCASVFISRLTCVSR